MKTTRFVIVGAGLSGLYATHQLQKLGIDDYVILEARDRLGGRIDTFTNLLHVQNKRNIDSFDLGPTWFWPDFQRDLQSLILKLNLEFFEQYDRGDMMAEGASDATAVRTRGYTNSPIPLRLMGGMGSMIDALSKSIDTSRVMLDQQVLSISCHDNGLTIQCKGSKSSNLTIWHCERLLLALPPRLAANTIEFFPMIPKELFHQWRSTPTWMAQHAKYIAVYDSPFWRDLELSGEARSGRGPLGEIHDASMPGGFGALFGFFNVPATVRSNVSRDLLLQRCRAQLARLFGQQALSPVAETIKDWAQDPFTATGDDIFESEHLNFPPDNMVQVGPWSSRLIGIASEWSTQYPGYLAGAVHAADAGVETLMSIIGS